MLSHLVPAITYCFVTSQKTTRDSAPYKEAIGTIRALDIPANPPALCTSDCGRVDSRVLSFLPSRRSAPALKKVVLWALDLGPVSACE